MTRTILPLLSALAIAVAAGVGEGWAAFVSEL